MLHALFICMMNRFSKELINFDLNFVYKWVYITKLVEQTSS